MNISTPELFAIVERREPHVFLSYLDSFRKQYLVCRQVRKYSQVITQADIEACFDDACIEVYDKIAAKQLTLADLSSSLESFVFRNACYKCQTKVRAMIRRNKRYLALSDEFDCIDPNPNAIEKLERDEQQQQLSHALNQLGEKDKFFLLDAFAKEHSQDEVAKKYNLASRASVATKKNKLLKRLIKFFQGTTVDH